MMSTLRATAILSSSSFITILVGLATTKAWAVLLGPGGLGYMGLLQGLLGFAGVIAGTGIGTGLVRMCSHANAQGNVVRVAALRRAAWLLTWAIGGVVALVIVIFREPISILMLGGSEHAWAGASMSIALIMTLAAGIHGSLLNAHHRVKALAQSGIASSVLGAIVSLLCVWQWREDGVVPAIIGNALVLLLVNSWLLRRHVIADPARPSRHETLDAIRSLLRFGVPFSASTLVGIGVQFILPALVLHSLGSESVGLYRAAIAISVTYLGFMLTAMNLDYYPRISAVSDQAGVIVGLINDQLRLILMLIVPLIFAMVAVAPIVTTRLYSSEFAPSTGVLEWQLTGDLLKFWSWTMGTVLLARGRTKTIFFIELVFGLNILFQSLLAMRWFGLVGSGIGFLSAYAVHFVLVWAIVRRDVPLAFTRENRLLMIFALGVLLVVQGLQIINLELAARSLALVVAVLAGGWSLNAIWREHARERLLSREPVPVPTGEA